MMALDALDRLTRAEVLVTCADFGPGQPNGIALARMARIRRPGIKVFFVGEERLRQFAAGVATFIPSPVALETIAEVVLDTLQPGVADLAN